MKTLLAAFLLSILIAKADPIAPERVAVLYNSSIPESRALAEFYAHARRIPMENLVGLPLSAQGQISREEYNSTLRDPLRAVFANRNWWTMGRTQQGIIVPVSNKINTLVCMRGVPYKIRRHTMPEGQASKGPKIPGQFAQSTEAAVDSELCLLGVLGMPAAGPLNNPYYKKNKAFAETGINHVMLVGRIDAPDFSICKRMISDAIATEARGLWGMCYLDLAKKGGGYAAGDKWLENIAQLNFTTGIPTVTDRNKQTFTTNYPMNDAALYYGWYTKHRNGPLLNENFRFRQGAVAVHLHSYSASNLHSNQSNWTGPILSKGAAATLGNVYEPYLQFTHHFDIFHDRLLNGFSLIEAAYMALPVLSWQNVVLGDPLYRPFIHLDGSGELAEKDRDYRAIRVANERWGKEPETLIRKLRTVAASKANGRLYEYLGLWHRYRKQHQIALAFFDSASKRHIKESDRLRQWLYTADIHRQNGNKRAAIEILRQAQLLISNIPESKTTLALLNILDPPPPPPAKSPDVIHEKKPAAAQKTGHNTSSKNHHQLELGRD